MANQTPSALAGVRLDHLSPVPLYHQAALALERAIEDGRLPRGSKLDGELELAEHLGISRPTMRAALKQLVDKGLLIRRRGIGTIVATKPVRRAIALTSLLGQDAKAQDADAKQTAKTLQTAMRICGIDQGGSFTEPRSCNLRRLREIEPSLAGSGVNANPSSPSGGFTVRASSGSGNTFTVTRHPDGDVERTCKVKNKDTTGGCNLTKGKNGSW